MKDAYGTEIEVGCLVVFNYSGHLAKGTVMEIKERHHFGSKMMGKEIVVKYIQPPLQHTGYRTVLETRPEGALVKCNQVVVVSSPVLMAYNDFEPMKATLASVNTNIEEEFRPQIYTPASLIRDFRDKYGCGIEEARKALQMAGNDEQKALELIRLPFGMEGKYFEEWEKKNEVD